VNLQERVKRNGGPGQQFQNQAEIKTKGDASATSPHRRQSQPSLSGATGQLGRLFRSLEHRRERQLAPERQRTTGHGL